MKTQKTLDWNEYVKVARQIAAEGCVLVENNGALPLKKDSKVSVFGRIQNFYYKSGTGSGGMVNVNEVIDIPTGFRNSGMVTLNEELAEIYKKWEEENPVNEGLGWGQEPWSQEEMEVDEELVKKASENSDIALVIIGRTAGEDRDANNDPGSNLLTDKEKNMLEKVRANFSQVVVVLNVGGIIDMSFIDEYKPDAVLYVWQGGMIGGDGAADVLTGKICPSGRFTDTCAYETYDHYSDKNFGGEDEDIYEEDIYVGYRYFETFAKDKVRYPFGYGLSYTDFEINTGDVLVKNIKTGETVAAITQDNVNEVKVSVTVSVKNTGKVSGKEVVQVYVENPQGKLGKPVRVLTAFGKTRELTPGESETLTLEFMPKDFASYDDSGVTGKIYSFVLEAGSVNVYAGKNVRDAINAGSVEVTDLVVVEKLFSALAPVKAFDRIKPEVDANGEIKIAFEATPFSEPGEDARRLEYMPEEIPQTTTEYPFSDVAEGKISLEEFVAQLNDDDLCCIIRGEGMGSSKVTPGTASAFAGANDRLMKLGVPAVCCDDGPSGMRLDSGVKAFSLPNGTMQASTFDPELIEKLYSFTGLEMVSNKVECLLGPGMNIHRHPLNGRNFEYFSEDPLLTGYMAAAVLRGLQSAGVTGTIKHFCGNNQEHRRHFIDSVISERALREIYLKGFEMVVKDGLADSIMTTYGSVNGLYTCGNFDLNTTILRKQWGFKGIVMSDWWASISERNVAKSLTNFGAMVRAQNDLFMVCSDSSRNADGDTIAQSLAEGKVNRSELQRSALNILSFAVKTQAMKRTMGTETVVEILNRPLGDDDINLDGVEFIKLTDNVEIRLDDRESKAGTNYIIALDMEKTGNYKITLTGSSALSRVAQIPCTLFSTGIPVATFSFRGTASEDRSIERMVDFYSRFSILRLYVARNGVELKNIKFEYVGNGTFIDGNR